MSSTRLRVGDAVPLVLQLESRATSGRWPQAVVYDDANGVLATRDLTHVAGGLYADTGYPMPDEPLLRVRYEIYTDAGHGTVSETDRPACDAFAREDSAEPGDAMALTAAERVALDTVLSDAHGDAQWDAVASGFATAADVTAARDAVLTRGGTGPWTTGPTAPTVVAIADAVLDELVLDHDVSGSLGQAITWIRRGQWSKVVQRGGDPGQLDVYNDARDAVLVTLDLHDEDGNAIGATVGVPAQNDGMPWPPT